MNDSTTFFVSAQREILVLGRFFNGSVAKVDQHRSAIHGFSERSRRRMRSFLRNSVPEYNGFITLTYPPGYGDDGPTCKAHLKTFLERLKRLQTRPGDRRVGYDGRVWSILWFQEWQKNGRLHFHLCASHYFDKEWLSQAWFDIVGSQNLDHLRVGTQVKKLVGGRKAMEKYASKYCSKADQKVIPEGFGWAGRFWGVWGCALSVAASMSWNRRALRDNEKFSLVLALNKMIKKLISEQKIEKVLEKGEKKEFKIYKFKDEETGFLCRRYISLVKCQMLLVLPKEVDAFTEGNVLNMDIDEKMTKDEAITDYSDLMIEGVEHDFSLYRTTKQDNPEEVHDT